MPKFSFASPDIRSDRTRWSLSFFAVAMLFFFGLSAGAASAQISISVITPNSGPLAGGNTIKIYGKGLDGYTSVWISSSQASVLSASGSEIDVQAPPKRAAGAADVALFSDDGESARVAGGYTYTTGATPPPVPPPPGPNPPPPPPPPPDPNPNPGPTPSGSALNSCGDLTKPGSYYLTQDVSASGTCFFIDANSITLNLNGHTITYATGGGSQSTPGVLLADDWYSGYGIAQSGSTGNHGNFEMYGGNIVEAANGPARSPAVWMGQSNHMVPAPKIHDLTLKTYSEDSSPIFGTFANSGLQIYNNNIYYSATKISNRDEFYGQAIYIGDGHSGPPMVDQIYNNHIYTSPQGGIRDVNPNAKIYNNDITFNSLYSNDFCVDSPADGQEIYGNTCHPTSGRGVHVIANNTYVHDNTITVQELSQNAEYNGCELGGAYGVQIEFDYGFIPTPPVGIRIANNHIHATAGDCLALGLRMTDMIGNGGVSFTNNDVTTTNQGRAGMDYGISFDNVIETGSNFQFSGNTFNSQHAYVTSAWDGASVVIPAGQNWVGSPQYSIDNENGGKDPWTGPNFSQSITVDDSTPGTIHCGVNATGYNRDGNQTLQCN